MGALLALFSTKDLVYGALIAMLIAAGAWERHHLITEGAQHELAALQASSDRLEKKAAAETANLQAKATMAEQAHDKEVTSLINEPTLSVRVCKYPDSGTGMSQASTAQPGNAAASAGSGALQSVPSRDSGRRDIGPMLSALGVAADKVSATLREFQSR